MFKTGNGCRRGRLAAQAVFADNRLGIENLFVRDRTNDAVADINRPQAFFQIDRPGYFYRRGAGVRRKVPGRQIGVIIVDDCLVNMAVIPRELLVIDQVGQSVGSGRVNYRHPRHLINQAQLFQLREGLAEGAGVAEIPARHYNPVRHLPAEALDDAIHNGLLPFEPERIE